MSGSLSTSREPRGRRPVSPTAGRVICRKGTRSAKYDSFTAWFDARSLPFLEDALVDYSKDRMGGQLTIKAPNAKMPRVDEDSPLEDRINYVLYNEVNPALAAHGGEVSLVEITDDSVRGAAVWRRLPGVQRCRPDAQGRRGKNPAGAAAAAQGRA